MVISGWVGGGIVTSGVGRFDAALVGATATAGTIGQANIVCTFET